MTVDVVVFGEANSGQVVIFVHASASTMNVKICCISSLEEAYMAIEMGASALGLVGPMPSGPGVIDAELARRITAAVSPAVATFLLTSETTAEGIIAHHRKVNTTTIQLVDAPEEGTYKKIRQALPQVELVQVIHVVDEASITQAQQVSSYVDAILLDSGDTSLETKELGGTGRTHNWDISKAIVECVDTPVYLAGGLNAENVSQAVAHVKPYGVDLCRGVRTNGALNGTELRTFFAALRGVDE